MPYHLTIPVELHGTDQAVLTVTVSELTAYETHGDRGYGPWRCDRTSPAEATPVELTCTLPDDAASSTLGLDLGGPVGATVTASVAAPTNDDPDPSNNALSWEMPEIDQGEK